MPALSGQAIAIGWLLLPFLAAFLSALLPALARWLALLCCAATALMAAAIALGLCSSGPCRRSLPGAIELLGPYGVSLRLDGFAAPFLLLNALVGGAVLLDGWRRPPPGPFLPLLMVLHGGLDSAFVAVDLISLYVTLEVVGVSAFLLILISRSERTLWVALRYLLIGNTVMTLYLIGAAVVYLQTGQLPPRSGGGHHRRSGPGPAAGGPAHQVGSVSLGAVAAPHPRRGAGGGVGPALRGGGHLRHRAPAAAQRSRARARRGDPGDRPGQRGPGPPVRPAGWGGETAAGLEHPVPDGAGGAGAGGGWASMPWAMGWPRRPCSWWPAASPPATWPDGRAGPCPPGCGAPCGSPPCRWRVCRRCWASPPSTSSTRRFPRPWGWW